jgi:hypothetical protein
MAAGRYQQTKLYQLSFAMAGRRPGPSTSFSTKRYKDVDARHKAGHDDGDKRKAPAARPGLEFAI